MNPSDNPLSTLQALGLELPGPAYLIDAIVFELIGWAAWRHGRKTQDRTTLWLGVALMFYPNLVSGMLALYAIDSALCVALVVRGATSAEAEPASAAVSWRNG